MFLNAFIIKYREIFIKKRMLALSTPKTKSKN